MECHRRYCASDRADFSRHRSNLSDLSYSSGDYRASRGHRHEHDERAFFSRVGTGENLNEHILASHWPPVHIRQEMLAEAVQLIRALWRGGMNNYEGKYFSIEQAQVFTLPKQPPPIMSPLRRRARQDSPDRSGTV